MSKALSPSTVSTFYSASGCLFSLTCNMRNPSEAPAEDGCILTFAKRFTAELCFVPLVILGLIEAVVRAVFAIPAFFLTLCTGTKPNTFGDYLWAATWSGARYSLTTSLNSLAGLVVNLVRKEIVNGDILPRNFNDCLIGED